MLIEISRWSWFVQPRQQLSGHTRIDTTKTIYASRVSQLAIDAPHQLAELLIDFEGEFGLSPEIEITKRKSPNNLDGA